jgi:hypothetical protein
MVSRQRPPAKQVAWIFGHRPKRQKRTVVLFALNLPPGAKHPVFMARISVDKISNRCTQFFSAGIQSRNHANLLGFGIFNISRISAAV